VIDVAVLRLLFARPVVKVSMLRRRLFATPEIDVAVLRRRLFATPEIDVAMLLLLRRRVVALRAPLAVVDVVVERGRIPNGPRVAENFFCVRFRAQARRPVVAVGPVLPRPTGRRLVLMTGRGGRPPLLLLLLKLRRG
jgi:hypothetical protein